MGREETSKAGAGRPQGLTLLLRRFTSGDPEAGSIVLPAIEKELRRIASHHMRHERKDHTLQTTALINEAYLRLAGTETGEWNDRKHFFAVAASVMRQVLVDYARARRTAKRAGHKVELDTATVWIGPVQPHLLDLDIALSELALFAPREARLVELHFFAGLSLEEAAKVLEISPRTADKDWALARAWLRKRLRPS